MKVYVVYRDYEESYEGIYATLEAAKKRHEGKWIGPITQERYVTGNGTVIVSEHPPRWDLDGDDDATIYEEDVLE